MNKGNAYFYLESREAGSHSVDEKKFIHHERTSFQYKVTDRVMLGKHSEFQIVAVASHPNPDSFDYTVKFIKEHEPFDSLSLNLDHITPKPFVCACGPGSYVNLEGAEIDMSKVVCITLETWEQMMIDQSEALMPLMTIENRIKWSQECSIYGYNTVLKNKGKYYLVPVLPETKNG